jgi:exonuclease III
MGDFNEITDSLDSTKKEPITKTKSKDFITHLQTHNFTDTFRYCHLSLRSYIYTRSKSAYGSRIDHIWTTPSLLQHIIEAYHTPLNTIINSDHKMVTLHISTPHSFWSRPANRTNQPQNKIDYHNSSTNQWKQFTEATEEQANKILASHIQGSNTTWNKFKETMLSNSKKYLKKRKTNRNIQTIRKTTYVNIMQNPMNFGKLYREYSKWIKKPEHRNEPTKNKILNLINKINEKSTHITTPLLDTNENANKNIQNYMWLTEIKKLWKEENLIATTMIKKEK